PLPFPKANAMTHYQVIVGPGAVFDGPEPLTLGQLTAADGVCKTILLADAADAVPWTKPADLSFDPKGPLSSFGRLNRNLFAVCFGDGSTRDYRFPTSEKGINHLRALITWNGGERVDMDHVPD